MYAMWFYSGGKNLMKQVLKFMVRFISHLLLFLLVLFPLQLIGALALLFYLPIQRKLVINNPTLSWKLPYILRWFDNADLYVGRNTTTYLLTVIPQGWWVQYCWLAWRNPLNYFGYTILGVLFNKPVIQTIYTDEDSLNVGDTTAPGFFYTEVVMDDNIYYEYYYIKTYKIFNIIKCFRFRLGYKLGRVSVGQISEWVFVISPYHSYTGI